MKLPSASRWALLALSAAVPPGASAFEFDVGEVDFSLDTTVSLGATRRMQDPSASLIGIANGGSARTVNEDDGNLNYQKGDWISAAAKATSDFAAKYEDSGLFARATYSRDFQASRAEFLGPKAHDRLDSDFELLDAMLFTTVEPFEHPINLRFGRQVVNWGESTFIGNSINVINPIDVAKLRTPGAEIKEALLPIPALLVTTPLTENLAIEALAILDYKSFKIDPRGTFFSTNDSITDDGDRAYAGSGRRNDQHRSSPDSEPTSLTDPTAAEANASTAAHSITRVGDRKVEHPRDQYGLALHYLADWLNDSEIGLYYLHYHSRIPTVSALRDSGSPSDCAVPGTCLTPIVDVLQDRSTVHYFAEFPEGIQLYGLSFNTNIPFGIALQGEYSYRPNLPVQLSATELLLGALRQNNAIDRAEGVDPRTAPVYAAGFRRVKAHQVQTTFTKAFGPTLGANQFVLLGEAGATYLDLPDRVPFNGPGTALPDCDDGTVVLLLTNGSCQHGEGYTTKLSYAYRLLTRMDFEDVLFGAQVSPRLIFTHDVHGVNSASGFNQGAKVIIGGIGITYLQRYGLDVSYTVFTGGRTYRGTDPGPPPVSARGPDGNTQSSSYATGANPSRDRDFLSLSVSYSF